MGKEKFNKFKEYCLKYKKIFGLIGWRIAFDSCENNNGPAATTRRNPKVYVATIEYNHKAKKREEDTDERIARHEMLHVMLGKMVELYIQAGKSNEREDMMKVAMGEEENIVNTLEELIGNREI